MKKIKDRNHSIRPGICMILTLLFSLILISPSRAVEALPLNVQTAIPEGGPSAPMQLVSGTSLQNGQYFDALEVTFEHALSYNSLIFPAAGPSGGVVDATEFKYLGFRVKFDTVDEDYHNFTIRLRDLSGNWAATNFLDHATQLPDGSYVFQWDMGDPDVSIGFDPETLTYIDFQYGFPTIPVGDEVVATFSRMHLSKEPVLNINLSGSYVAGGAPGMLLQNVSTTIDGHTVPGRAATLDSGTSGPALYIPAGGVNANYSNILEFRVAFDNPDEDLHNFSVRLISFGGGWCGTTFSKHATKLSDGTYLFSWDVLNNTDQDYGIDLAAVQRIEIIYDYNLIPATEELVITLSDMNFISGRVPLFGDPVLWPEWLDYILDYEPDYSDSSSALLPPLTGRIPTPLSLATSGAPAAEIVLSATSSPVEANAASELQHWIKEISNAELPIVNTATGAGNTKLYIGRSFAEAGFSADITTLDGSDGYAIRTSGSSIYIFGAKPKGTLNGVFAFIENNSDLIWARPHPDYGTIFSKNPNFSAVWANVCDRPVGKVRGCFFNSPAWDDRNYIWSDRNRNNFNAATADRSVLWGNRIEAGGGHNLHTLIPTGNPLYYPTINGVKPGTLSIWEHQICMSVPNLAQAMAGKVIDAVQAQPHSLDVYSVKIEDNWGVCECVDCTAPISLPGGGTLAISDPAFRSTQFYMLLNEITEEVNLTYPNLKLQTYAYFFTAVPPKVELNENIEVLFCPYIRKDHRTPLSSPANDHWWNMLTGFADQTSSVFVREYYGILNEGRPLAEVVAADFRSYVDMGVVSIGAEMNTDVQTYYWDGVLRGAGEEFDLNMMDYWILNRIYWNPDVDVEALRKYFIRRTFREAAPAMEKFFGVIRDKWYDAVRPASDWGNFKKMIQQAVVTPGREAEIIGYLEEAAEDATHPVSRVLISRITDWFLKTVEDIHYPTPPNNTRTPARSLLYGWSPSVGTNIYPTTIELGGEFIPALHVKIQHPITPYGPDLACNFPHDLTGLDFRFVIIPKNPSDSIPGPLFSFMNTVWKTESVSASAYTASSLAPNALEFNWTPSGVDDLSAPMDLTSGGTLRLTFDRAVTPSLVPPAGLDFYIIELEALP